jgi:hypothetical protein
MGASASILEYSNIRRLPGMDRAIARDVPHYGLADHDRKFQLVSLADSWENSHIREATHTQRPNYERKL